MIPTDASYKIKKFSTDDEMIPVIITADDNIQVKICDSDPYMNIESDFNTVIRKGYSPYISEITGTWWEYDDRLKIFIDTKVNAIFNFLSNKQIELMWNTIEMEDE